LGDAGSVLATMFSGSGCDALGGSDAVVPCPGALSGRAPPVWIWFAPAHDGDQQLLVLPHGEVGA
jgi:hypothetical protein